MNFLISSAYAQDASGAGLFGGASGLLQVLPFVGVFAVFYFLLIRPQQQRQKQLRATVAGLKRGDRVITAGGIIGVVQKAKDGDSEIEVEIAPTVRVLVLRDTISSVVTPQPVRVANDAAPDKKAGRS